MKPLGNERQHSLSRKDEKAQRKAGKAKDRQAAKRDWNEILKRVYI